MAAVLVKNSKKKPLILVLNLNMDPEEGIENLLTHAAVM